MKIRESGMPEESLWTMFFEPASVLRKLGLAETCSAVADIGCGYGTFTIPAAQMIRGTVHAIDLESTMLGITRANARAAGLTNVRTHRHDFVAAGTGLPDASVGYAMLFNILHAEKPRRLLEEAYRVLAPNGIVGVMHWNHDPSTPRGPSLDIRPHPEQCRAWAEGAGFRLHGPPQINLPPYHFGLVLGKPAQSETVDAEVDEQNCHQARTYLR